MAIKPTQLAVKFLFEQNHTFMVPKYQRGYAWDDEAIEDFIEDIARCLSAREADKQRNHFFGGIVTVRMPIANSNRSNYEVIDGQQRLASFVMLVAVIVRGMRNIVGELVKKSSLSEEEQKAKKFLEDTIDSLRGVYLVYRDEIELEYVEIPKLSLSVADNDFFQNIVAEQETSSERASHERIKAAWDRLVDFVDTTVLKSGSPWEKAKRLRLLVNSVLATDCSVIFMCSETKSEAYQIFQVLNDRGVHLTDGDLLRASTMELLDAKPLATIQNKVAEQWDKVLAYPPGDIDSYLRWYFSSWQGKRPKSSNVADQFMEFRFGGKDRSVASKAEAQAVLNEVRQLDRDFALLRTLGEGDWPYTNHSTVDGWDRERLRMLVTHLKHTNAMPLLLSLQRLDAKKFAEAVSAIERFVFRFKTIGNAHIAPMTELYLRHAKKIRDTASYKIGELRKDLKALAGKAVPDELFEANLNQVKYSVRGGNGHIRYMLITLEDYAKWYEQGAQGVPKCKDKTRVFDFSNTTLEHVYPQSAKGADKVATLEEVKHTIGNLTIFGPNDNEATANKSYSGKRVVLKASNLKLNRDISENDQWTAATVDERTKSLISMAVKVFVP